MSFTIVTNARRSTLYHSSGLSCVMQPGHQVKIGVTPRGLPLTNDDAIAMILNNGLDAGEWPPYITERDILEQLRGENGFTVDIRVLKKRYKHLYKTQKWIKAEVIKEFVWHLAKLCVPHGPYTLTLKPEYQQ